MNVDCFIREFQSFWQNSVEGSNNVTIMMHVLHQAFFVCRSRFRTVPFSLNSIYLLIIRTVFDKLHHHNIGITYSPNKSLPDHTKP